MRTFDIQELDASHDRIGLAILVTKPIPLGRLLARKIPRHAVLARIVVGSHEPFVSWTLDLSPPERVVVRCCTARYLT